MFDNSIRGGQIFWHQLTMFKQVAFRSLSMSLTAGLLVLAFLKVPELPKYDFPAFISYAKAQVADWWHYNKVVLHKDALNSIATIDAYDKKGLYYKNIRAHTILTHNRFKAEHHKVIELIISSLLIMFAVSTSFLMIIFIIWSIFGKKAKATTLLRGGAILKAKEVASILGSKGGASHIRIGDMPLVKDSETKHILITGATGTGKTNLFHTILPQVRLKNQPALVIDQTGEMVERYYDKARGDIIFNPFDPRSHEWDFWSEIDKLPRLNSLASSIFSNSKSLDAMWNNSSKQVFIDCVTVIKNEANDRNESPSIAELYKLISSTPLKEASQRLQGYASSSLLSPAGDRTAMSIRSNTIAFLNWLEYLPETNVNTQTHANPKFTIKDWIADTARGEQNPNPHRCPHSKQNQKRDNAINDAVNSRWLFITSSPEERTMMKPLQSLLLDLAVLSIQQLQPSKDRRFWIIADELASLKKLDILPQSLAELRKYGGCIMTALQSLNQLYEIYGQNNASTMFGQFGTKLMFRTSEPTIAKMISEMFGSIEYKEQQQNTSYGAHEHRDGISYTEQERRKALVTVDDLASLADLECFVELPEPSVRIARIKMPIVKTSIPKTSVSNSEDGNNRHSNTDTDSTTSTPHPTSVHQPISNPAGAYLRYGSKLVADLYKENEIESDATRVAADGNSKIIDAKREGQEDDPEFDTGADIGLDR